MWKEDASKGYGLASICDRIGYKFQHHNAMEDAKAAGHVVLAAMDQSSLNLDELIKCACQPISSQTGSSRRNGSYRNQSVIRDGNPDGPLVGHVVVFTGALTLVRREAADLASAAGASVASSVGRKITLLVVGDTDMRQLAGHEKSAKQRTAEKLIDEGIDIRVLQETDFRELISSSLRGVQPTSQ